MIEALIPYFHAPERTLVEDLPILGPLKLQVFGPLVAVGVIVGWKRCLHYAKLKDIDEFLFRDYLFWMLVFAFVISHWVSVLFYFPEQVAQDWTVLLKIWNGLSSVGGFFGAFVGMTLFLRAKFPFHNMGHEPQPLLPYADATIFGLLIGWCFGRAGCSAVHDHPGKIVPEGTFLAVGPWPDGTWRYDLGLLEFFFAVTLTATVYLFVNWRNKRPGWLVGLVVVAYAPFRFVLDFFRADEAARGVISTPDERYAGLTPAQWFTIAFFMAGLYLLLFRKPKAGDFDYAKNSDRLAREAEARGDGGEAEDESKRPEA